jgi:hypothetical protein
MITDMAGFSLQVVVPLLVSEDEQALVTCISCLTKVHPFFPCSLKCDKKLFQFKVVTKKKNTLQWTSMRHFIIVYMYIF